MLVEKAGEYVPKLVVAGGQLIIGLLNGIAQEVPGMANAATSLLIAFLKSIGDQTPRLIQAGFNLILTYVNSLSDAIVKESGPLGQAAVKLAGAIIQGMINGIAAGAKSVVDAVGNMASSALSSAGHLLGINSPSKEFYKIGAWSAEGMANGIDENADMVSKSSANMGKAALTSMTKTLSTLSDAIPNNMDIKPVITPVLDLTSVKQDAGQIGDMLKGDPIAMQTSYARAVALYQSDYLSTPDATQHGISPTKTSPPVVFNQYNSSPTALSSAEIYRLTKNQLSVAKGYYVFENGSGG
jgi:hypothetical protein